MDSFLDELADYHSRLRSQALLYKELKTRHDPAVDTEERIHKVIISSQSDDIFLKDPDIQNESREKFIEGLQQPPSLPLVPLYADTLLSEYIKATDEFSPSTLRQLLSDYFSNQVSYLSQYRFKLLSRWAYLEEQGQAFDIDEQLEKLNQQLLDYTERAARLKEDDEFGSNQKKPVPKTSEGTNLYLHSSDIGYTNISKEDIKIYLSQKSQISNKTRVFENFLIRAKWISTFSAFDVWEKMIEEFVKTRKMSIERMHILTGNDLESAKSALKSFRKPMTREEIEFQDFEIEMPPLFISDIKQLQGIVRKISKEFGLKGEMELDDGHSLAYQVTHLFPELYELQKLKLEWVSYGNLNEKINAEKRLLNLQFMKSYRVTFIRKNSSSSETNIPILKSFSVAFLKRVDWNKAQVEIKTPGWLYRQNVRMNKIEKINSELEEAFHLIDQQNVMISNKALEDIVFHHQISQKTHEIDQKKEETGEKTKTYFSILLAENITKQQTSQVKIPSQMIKTYYMLVLLKNRKIKNQIIDLLNVFRSIQRKLCLDLNDFDLRENFIDFSISQKSKLHDRCDLITEINEEVYVKDGNGEFIVYDCVLEDYKDLTKELMKLGTFYINKYSECKNYDFSDIDVNTLASELLELEYEFQQAKFKLITTLMHFYNNYAEKEIQLKLSYRILKLLHYRPRLWLRNSYFYESYKSCISILESQHNLLTAIIQVYPLDSALFSQIPFNIDSIFSLLNETNASLTSSLSLESSKFNNFLTTSIWNFSFNLWKSVVRSNTSILSSGNLLDKPDFICKLVLSLLNDFKSGLVTQYPELEGSESSKLNEIQLLCNYCKLWSMKENLYKLIEESKVLGDFYAKQAQRAGKEVSLIDNLEWGTKLHSDVDEGSGNKAGLGLAVSEFDRTAACHINFSDVQEIRHMITPWGLQEFEACTQYQIMHCQALGLAVQVNQAYCAKFLSIIAEINVLIKHRFAVNKYSIELKDALLNGSIDYEKAEKVKNRNFTKMQKVFVNVANIKGRSRVQTLEKYKILMHLQGKGKKDKILAMLARRARISIISEYCKNVLQDLYPLAFKVQIFKVIEKYSHLVSVIPPSSYGFIFKGDQFYDLERGLFNFLSIPTIDYILDYPSKTIEDLSFSLHTGDLSKTVFFYKYTWNLSHDLMKILQSLTSLVQTLIIRFYLNFLSIPSEEIVELWESISNGERFFNNEKSNALEQTPETLIEDQITEAFSILKVLNETQPTLEKEERTRYLALYTRHTFDILTISILSTQHFILLHSKAESGKEVKIIKRRLFKYIDVDFPNKKFKVTQLSNATKPNVLVQAPAIRQLDWAFLNMAPAERSRGFTVAIAVQLKTENFLRSLNSGSKLQEIKALIEFLQIEINLLRLKFNFYRSQTGEYEILQEKYRETIEEKAEKIIQNVTGKKDIAKVNAEIKVVKDFFTLNIIKHAVGILDEKIKIINLNALGPEPFSILLPEKTSPDYLKKVNLLSNFFNLLKSRGTIVQAQTGKAIVYTMKDLASIVNRIADQTLRYKETEKREYIDKIFRQVQELKQKIRDRRKKLLGYKKSKIELEKEVSDMVTARITQKGAQFMYEIDVSQRQLKEIKENSHALEVQVREKITQEYIEKYRMKVEKEKSMREEFIGFQMNFAVGLKNSIDGYKIEGVQNMSRSSKEKQEGDESNSKVKSKGQTSTLVSLQVVLRRVRENGQWSRLQEMQKFQKHINELREQLTSNQYLLDQLNESKGREEMLKQELRHTQHSLQSIEKLESKLKQQIREMRDQEEALSNFKQENSEKLQKMQQRVNKFKDYCSVDKDKIEKEQKKQERLLKTLGHAKLDPEKQYQGFHNSYLRDIEKMKKKIREEVKMLENCEKLTVMTRAELDGIDHFEEGEWKRKYYELVAEQKFKDVGSGRMGAIHSPSKKLVIKRSDYTYFTTPERSNRSFR